MAIVQAERQPGPITLTASADGLQSATLTLTAQAATATPFVP
jgi:hypothetical protein